MFANSLPGRSGVSTALLMAGIVLGLYLCYLLAIPFLSPLVWSFTLAVLFKPLDAKLRAASRSPGFAATATTAVVAVMVVVPAIFVIGTLLGEAVRGASLVSSMADSDSWRNAIDAHPRLAPALRWLEERLNIPELIGTAESWLTRWSASLVRGSIAGFVSLLLTFYFLFYFLRDGDEARTALHEVLSLSAEEFSKLAERIVDTIHATVYGTLAVAALQGVLGGFMFWWLGLTAPLFWGVMMALLAVVPFLGAFVIWAPAAAYLVLAGDWWSAALLVVWGTAVVGLIDNVIYPILVGNRLMMHTVPAFIALVGGLLVFGTPGIILGPLVVAVSLALIRIWRRRAQDSGQFSPLRSAD